MSKGYIVAQLFTARQARPITNATVIISRPGTGEMCIRDRSYRICTEISQTSNIPGDKSRYRTDIEKALRTEMCIRDRLITLLIFYPPFFFQFYPLFCNAFIAAYG